MAEVEPEDALVTVVPRDALVEALRSMKQDLARHRDTIPDDMMAHGHDERMAHAKRAQLQKDAGDLSAALELLEAVTEDRVVMVNIRTLLELIEPADLRRFAEQDLEGVGE